MENKTIHPSERMIGAIARLLKNGERVATGTLSPIPAAGCFLAKYTHAPDLELLIYGDPENRLSEGFHELFGLAQQGKIDVFFLSGIQIDQRGSVNLSVLGDYRKPSLRLPGGAGSSMLYAMSGRTILFTNNHSPKLFVPKADFVNATGFDETGITPWRRGGLSHVVTPLCVMAFDRSRKQIILDYIFPGVTVDQVVENTGFDLAVEGRDIPTIDPLGETDLTTLRGPVQAKMRQTYPLFARTIWGAETPLEQNPS
jgi:glutaconate CoA-transferase subunit B